MHAHNATTSRYGGARTSKDYWDGTSYSKAPLSPRLRSEFQPFFDRYVPRAQGDASVLEIGACPGVHLAALARSHGYRPVALDFLPRVHDLREAFRRGGFPVVETIDTDFLEWMTERRFGVVMSLGFIEHFDDPARLVRLHWRLVSDDGVMVIGVPLFGRWQMWLRRRILPPDMLRSILRTHNLTAMDPAFLSETCRALPGSDLLFRGAIWAMHTWFRPSESYITWRGRPLLLAWKLAALIPRLLRWSTPSFSPYALFIVRKRCVPEDRA